MPAAATLIALAVGIVIGAFVMCLFIAGRDADDGFEEVERQLANAEAIPSPRVDGEIR